MTEQMGTVPVVHVAISDFAHTGNLEHVPMSLTALRGSVLRLDMDRPVPDGLDGSGIAMWRNAVAEEGAGAWAQPLKEVVALLTALNTTDEDDAMSGEAKEITPRWKFWKRWHFRR